MSSNGTSALADLRAVAVRSLALLRKRPMVFARGGLVAITLPFVILLVGVPLIGHSLMTGYRTALRQFPETKRRGEIGTTLFVGAAFTGYSLTAFFAVLAVQVPGTAPFYLAAMFFLGLLSLVGVCATVRGGLAEGFGRVAAAAMARPLSLFLCLSFPIALHSALGAASMAVVREPGFGQFGLVLAAIAISTTQIVIAPAIDEIVLAPRPDELRGPPVGVLAWLLPAPMLALGSAMIVALVVPLSAWRTGEAIRGHETRTVDGPLLLREDNGLTVELRPRAYRTTQVFVSTRDGGGTGAIDGLVGDEPVLVRETTLFGAHAYEIGRSIDRRVAFVDDDGVRLDDGIADRMRVRFWPEATLFVLASLGLIAALVSVMRRSAREAALLASRTRNDAGPKETVALAGALHLEDGATVTTGSRGRSIVRGVVRFKSDDGKFETVLREGEQAIDRGDAPKVSSGARAFVIAPASALRSGSYRDAPGREMLIVGIGSLERARQAYLTRAGRALVWYALPAMACMLAAAVALLLRSV